MRILLVKRDKIGDLLLTTSVFDHLRAALPDAELHLLANDYNAWVARGCEAIDRLWVYPRVRDGGKLRLRAALAHLPLALKLRAQHFDWAIAMNGEVSPRAIARTLGAGARRSVALVGGAQNRKAYGRRLTDVVPETAHGHELARMGALLRPLGVEAPAHWPAMRYCVPADDRAFIDRWLTSRALAPRSFIVLGLGARWPEKQPAPEQIVRWTSAFKSRWHLDTVLSWTPGGRDDPRYPGDDAIAQPVLARGLAHIHPFEGSVQQVAALLHFARTTVIPDSGLMHMAATSAGGVLGLFATTGGHDDPMRWHPIGKRALWLQAASTIADLPDAMLLDALSPLIDAAPQGH